MPAELIARILTAINSEYHQKTPQKNMAKAPYIEDYRLKHILKVAAVSGEFPVRNVALLTCVYGTGMMLTELARFPLSAYLRPDGSLREESAVAPNIAYNGNERPLYWSNAKVVAAIDKYLEFRVEHRHRVTAKKTAYRGLDGSAPLFLTDEGEAYKLTERRTATGAISYSCDSLSQLFRKLHALAGVDGASAMSGARWPLGCWVRVTLWKHCNYCWVTMN